MVPDTVTGGIIHHWEITCEEFNGTAFNGVDSSGTQIYF